MKKTRMDSGMVAGIIAIGALIFFATVAVMLVRPQQLKTTAPSGEEQGFTKNESGEEVERYVCRCECLIFPNFQRLCVIPRDDQGFCSDSEIDFPDEGSIKACIKLYTNGSCEGYDINNNLRAGTLWFCGRGRERPFAEN